MFGVAAKRYAALFPATCVGRPLAFSGIVCVGAGVAMSRRSRKSLVAPSRS
jgi:hypothetical protein